MEEAKFYILAWHDEGETNRAETIWEGVSPEEARKRFEEAEFTDNIWMIEAWINHSEYGEDIKLMSKWQ